MTDLVEFLRARLDEDERLARAAAPGPWHMDENQRIYAEDGAYVTAPWTEDERDDDLDHMARHDPARVLREVEAKRGMLAWHDRAFPHDDDPCTTQCLLVLPYADHPDYREEWRPADLA